MIDVDQSRRNFLRLTGSVAAASLVASCDDPLALLGRKRPNIIFIVADDQRNDTLGCTGDRIAKTPRIDALAAVGTVFDNMFVTTSICWSSRASMFTGVTETKHRITADQNPIDRDLCLSSYPALLKRAGYLTAMIGKFGVVMEGDAQKDFFDRFENRIRPNMRIMPDGSLRHIDEINVDSALQYMHDCSAADRPFLLSLNFSGPHAEDDDKVQQYHPIPWARNMYADIIFPPPKINDKEYFSVQPDFLKHSMNRERYMWRFDTPEKYQKNMRNYYQEISGIDHLVGKIIDGLVRLLVLDNTVLIYASDNGYYMGDRGFADKWTHYEESLRVPLVITDFRRGGAKAARSKRIVLNTDIPATILDFAGVAQPSHYQGRSLLPLIRQTPVSWRTDFLCQHTANVPTIPKWIGVRSERYMYARYYEQSPPYEFLHDLSIDPTEFKNFAQEPAYASVLSEQRARCDTLRRDLS